MYFLVNQIVNFKRYWYWNRTWLVETDPSERVFDEEESANDDFGGGLVVSDNAGQESAPMTVATSTTLSESLFQAGFFDRAALLLLAASKFSAAIKLSGGEEDEAEATFEEGKLSFDSDGEEVNGSGGDGDEGECWAAAETEADSGSPRTIWAQGEGKLFRRNWGLERPSPESPEARGEWWLEVESAVIATQIRVFRLKTESQNFNLKSSKH